MLVRSEEASPPRSQQRPRLTAAHTPSSRRILDVSGPTDMGELTDKFGELVRILKDPLPGDFDKAYAP